MVVVLEKTEVDSVITSATVNVAGARNGLNALHLATDHLENHGWEVGTERYEFTRNEDDSYTLTLY